MGKLVADKAADRKLPLVIVIHNFCGQVQWHEHVAEYMARLGYVGLAVDFYGEALVPHMMRALPKSMEEGMKSVRYIFEKAMFPLESNMPHILALFQKWMDVGSSHPSVDPAYKPAAIGYCLGGLLVFDAIRGGLQVGGVVGFHSVLHYDQQPMDFPNSFMTAPQHVPAALNYNTDAPCLVENGVNDPYGGSPYREVFLKEMADAGVKVRWHELEDAGHGFALATCVWGGSTEYHADCDRQSTLHMLEMFREIWPNVTQRAVARNAAGTVIVSKAT